MDTPSSVTALTLLIGLLAATAGCATKEPQEVGQIPCARVPAVSALSRVQANDVVIAPGSQLCTPKAQCVETNQATLVTLAGNFCNNTIGRTCRSQGSCDAPPRTCVSDARIGTPPTSVRLAACSSAPSPACPVAGEELCRCDLVVPAGQNLSCGCRCPDVPA